jgi:pyridoxal phosphate enzyme (YggS family)
VRGRIADAASRAGRSPHDIVLVAVSKAVDPALVEAARRAGQRDFGESRAQELRAKARAVDGDVRWHFVGRLQRNKVPEVVALAGLIHAVDRVELGQAIAEQARRAGRVQRVLVQVNMGRDPAKGGCDPADAAALISALRALDGLSCEGLMSVPPLVGDPRPTFAALRALRDELRRQHPGVVHLSMGMSRDFEAAVEEGATIVRVGEAVFGPRPRVTATSTTSPAATPPVTRSQAPAPRRHEQAANPLEEQER